MVVIGGYNSSNTISLAAFCAERVPTYHIEDATAIDPERGTIRYRPADRPHRGAERAQLARHDRARARGHDGRSEHAEQQDRRRGRAHPRHARGRPVHRRVTATAAPSYGTAELRAGDARVVIAPGLGGKIVSMWLAGREWLWSDPKLPHRLGQNADSGGVDECFPTAAACNLPAITGRYSALHLPNAYSGLALPERGELWSQPATFSLETKEEGVYATCGWNSERMPYSFVRALHVSNNGRVLMRYGVRNDGLDRLPYVWSSQAVLPLTKRTSIDLPDGARLRVWRQHGIELGGVGAVNRWPRVAAAGKLMDLSHPDAVARRYACKLFVDAPSGRVAIEEAGARLR